MSNEGSGTALVIAKTRSDTSPAHRPDEEPVNAAPPPAGAGHQRLQRLAKRRRLFVVVLTIALLAVGGYAARTYRAGAAWKESALEARAQRDAVSSDLDEVRRELTATEKDLADTRADLADTEQALSTAQTDRDEFEQEVADLEGRTRSLANEKAQVEDEREAAEQEAEYLGSVAVTANTIGTELTACIDGLYAWMGSTPDVYAGDYAWDRWSVMGDEISTQCGQAHADFLDLQDVLQ